MKKKVIALLTVASLVCVAEKTDSLKVLMIGNSFSISATRHMPQVAKSMGLELDLASLYIGGCSLERHWDNCAKGEKDPAFKPYKFTRFVDGEKKEDRPGNIPEALALEKWDVVTIQQASHFSWQPETYRPFGDDLIKKCIKPLASCRTSCAVARCSILGGAGRRYCSTSGGDAMPLFSQRVAVTTAVQRKTDSKQFTH